MKSTFFLASLMSTPWAMQPDVMHAYAKVLARQYGDKAADDAGIERPIQARVIAAAPRSGSANRSRGSIAVLPLYGVIMPRANMLEMCGGGTSIESFTKAFRSAMADETVGQILIDIDSPGGSVYGIGELAAEIRAARGTKPVVGIANHVAASAAYWAGSACSEFYVTPGGQVGSIGVIAAHEDMSKMLEAEGVNSPSSPPASSRARATLMRRSMPKRALPFRQRSTAMALTSRAPSRAAEVSASTMCACTWAKAG